MGQLKELSGDDLTALCGDEGKLTAESADGAPIASSRTPARAGIRLRARREAPGPKSY
ncbi:hypothetical protein ACFYXH_38825 [Streptomyces sp. NPDC002730]|uniref:hypothetical protein n=1 Tax=Streptomyces sp. NPDC002730 TaxID=3364662 RepID=UPI0036B14E39